MNAIAVSEVHGDVIAPPFIYSICMVAMGLLANILSGLYFLKILFKINIPHKSKKLNILHVHCSPSLYRLVVGSRRNAKFYLNVIHSLFICNQ